MGRSAATLAALLLVLLAGCSAAGSITMDPVSDAELADRASRGLGPASAPADDAESRAIRSAIENGSGTIDASSPPVEAGLPFAYDDAYYRLSWSVVDERTITAVTLEIDYNATDLSGPEAAYADLPAADRRALDALLPQRHDRETDGYDFGASSRYTDAELDRSVLIANERTVVRYDGEAYPVRVDGQRPVTINTYRYTASMVAEDTDAYARQLRDDHLFRLSGLTEAERSVVETAIEEGYYAEDTDDESFRAVLDRFRRQERVTGERAYGEWIVRYNGSVYWVDLQYGGFVDG